MKNRRFGGACPLGFHRAVIRLGPQRGDEVLLVRVLCISEENPHLVAEVLIDLDHILAKIGRQAGRRRIPRYAVIRQRNQTIEERFRRWIDRNNVIGERKTRSRIGWERTTRRDHGIEIRGSWIALTEVALAFSHVCYWLVDHRAFSVGAPFLGDKKERFVPAGVVMLGDINRATECKSPVVALQWLSWLPGLIQEPVVGVENVIADILE